MSATASTDTTGKGRATAAAALTAAAIAILAEVALGAVAGTGSGMIWSVFWGASSPIAEPDSTVLPRSLGDTGLYVDAEQLKVDPDHLAFSPQYPLWTDGATKRRWISLPSGTTVDGTDPDDWVFPVGTRIWKEFAFDGRPVETRYMERLADGTWAYAAYAWSDDGGEALLVGPGGLRGAHALPGGRVHAIPALSDCKACHQGQPTPVLGFSALQLSSDRDSGAPHAEVSGSTDLRSLLEQGLLVGLPDAVSRTPPRIAAASPNERAALGYLHGNCGHCHNRDGPMRSIGLSFRHETGLVGAAEAAVVTAVGVAARRLGSEGRLRIAPGDPGSSLVVERVASRAPTLQMPPLGTVAPDDDAVALLRDWITHMDTRLAKRN